MTETTHRQEFIQLDVPDHATYATHPITEIVYNTDLDRLCIIYTDTDSADGWSQLVFTNCTLLPDNTPKLSEKSIPPGLLSPTAAASMNTLGAAEAETLYNTLRTTGVVLPEHN